MKCSDCIETCPLNEQDIETVCKRFKGGGPEQGVKAEEPPTPTQCVGMVLYEPPREEDR